MRVKRVALVHRLRRKLAPVNQVQRDHRRFAAAEPGARAVLDAHKEHGVIGEGRVLQLHALNPRREHSPAGESVARGYWKRPEENQNTFNAMISDGDLKTYLRTGDLGFLKDGELFITGRLKDLIIIRGSNHYPQDIELTVEGCHEAMHVAGGGAFSIDVGDEERLVVVHEIDRQYRRSDLAPAIQAIRRAVAENHDLQVYAIALIKPFTIPKTSSGKIKRHACKAMYLNGELDVITEWRASD